MSLIWNCREQLLAVMLAWNRANVAQKVEVKVLRLKGFELDWQKNQVIPRVLSSFFFVFHLLAVTYKGFKFSKEETKEIELGF